MTRAETAFRKNRSDQTVAAFAAETYAAIDSLEDWWIETPESDIETLAAIKRCAMELDGDMVDIFVAYASGFCPSFSLAEYDRHISILHNLKRGI